jgi:NitT/TauT family transport system substrate-binding protein
MRRRGVLSVLTILMAAGLVACGGSGDDGADPTVRIGYFQGNVAGPEAVIAATKTLSDPIKGQLRLIPIDSGVAGLAELRGGAFQVISGVGNPPVDGAIATGTPIEIVYAESFDGSGLVVDSSVRSTSDLAGRTVGDLTGSSQDFEIRGWLKQQGLADTVHVVGFASQPAVVAAYESHKIDAAYVGTDQELALEKTGAREVVTAAAIAKLGYPSLNVLAVTKDFSAAHPDVVQQLVCQVATAQSLMTGAQAATYITPSAKLLGVPPEDAIAGTKEWPYIPIAEEVSWFHGADGSVANGPMAKALLLTAKFLKDEGTTQTVPTIDDIVAHIDAHYVEKALADGCGK